MLFYLLKYSMIDFMNYEPNKNEKHLSNGCKMLVSIASFYAWKKYVCSQLFLGFRWEIHFSNYLVDRSR